MKFAIPEISWHNRDPVLSVDFQPKKDTNEQFRLATGGTDSHVLIWYISTTDSGSVNLEVAADLTRHQKAVNVVRWSPSGQYLASGDDESIIFLWVQKMEKDSAPTLEGEEQYKESWVIHKTLRGHMEDVLDISWSADSLHLASGSVDNKLLIWDVGKGRYSSILTDHKGFVQGVAWDPKGQFIASTSTDRVFRTFDVTSKKVVSRSSKAVLPFPPGHPFHQMCLRLYHDDTLQTYYRRLQFSPDGMLVAVPAGRIEPEHGKMDMKPINAVYIYTRYSLKVPACVLPCGEPALVVRWSPRYYALRARGPTPAFPLAARMLLAVATKRSVLIYDTQQKTPIALISNIHYTRLTDLSWSPDGQTLVASSTDGFCSIITFTDGELGEVSSDELVAQQEKQQRMETQSEDQVEAAKEKIETNTQKTTKQKVEDKSVSNIDSFITFKPPQKSPKKQKTEVQQKTPVKIDLLVDTAMPSWSDNSSNEMIKPQSDLRKEQVEIMDVDSEDIKLVYEDTENKTENQSLDNDDMKLVYEDSLDTATQSPKEPKTDVNTSPDLTNTPKTSSEVKNDPNNFLKQAKVTDIKESGTTASIQSPKAPRRVSFVTLSSPKNTKKK